MILVTWNMQGAHSSADLPASRPTAAAPAAVPAGAPPKKRGTKRKRGDVDTSNLATVLDLFKQKKTDVICLQEAGACPRYIGGTAGVSNGVRYTYGRYESGSSTGSSTGTSIASRKSSRACTQLTVYFMWFDTGLHGGRSNNRCSMAILSKEKPVAYNIVKMASATLRPMIGMQLGSGQWVYCIHAPSGNHKSASGVANALLNKIKGTKYVCAGDFNCSPLDMSTRGHHPVYSQYVTHQGGNSLDFAIANGCRLRTANDAIADSTVLISDHFSQTFEVT